MLFLHLFRLSLSQLKSLVAQIRFAVAGSRARTRFHVTTDAYTGPEHARRVEALMAALSISISISLNLAFKKISKNLPLKSGRIDGTFRKQDDAPSFSYLKSTLIEPHSTQEPTNSSQDMGRS
ncbi:hypothetical protein AVEN_85527-1 [Araneus ventricosus]|uniref:Uncharacterized protein n=1 Tax=Araneus ventricosus TaxID=182803 RepID=A0A4Y2R7X3_ARAVE|nr:hypothetical protein AVEN_97946-1 [Araneus ventricosus]GBN71867.1 hypothetical protein AVEN_85527-1 [Araneus ventricosus]